MWEFCLYFNENQLGLIKKLKKQLKRIFKTIRGVVVLNEEKCELSFATELSEKNFIKVYKYVYNYITNIIYIYYKTNIINQLHSNMFNNEIFELMIKQMLFCFDEEYDKQIIRSTLLLEDSLNLDGIFNFKLFALKQKWGNLTQLIKNNMGILNSYLTGIDLTRFLLAELDNNIDKVCLFREDKKYFLKTTTNQNLYFNKKNYSKKQTFKQLLKNLITLSPKNIILCCDLKAEDLQIFRDVFIDKLKK